MISPAHPTETAGDGKTISQSNSIKRSENRDNMIACAQCGFIVDLTKRPAGDSMGAVPSALISSATFTPPRGALQTDVIGDPVDSGSGCPFCNSMNPRGWLRSRDPFSKTINLENL